MVRTLEAALEYIEAHGMITEIPTHGIPSLAQAVVGKQPVEGSVWQHAKGNLVYRIGRKLRASPEVLALRLWDGKMTFVDRRLWPEVYRIVMEPTRRRAALHGLSPKARHLLEVVERDGEVQLPRHEWVKERETLEARLLVHASTVEVDGEYRERLQSWRRWAPDSVTQIAQTLEYDEAVHALAARSGEEPAGPWMPAV